LTRRDGPPSPAGRSQLRLKTARVWATIALGEL
jgi:hypothetical protein